MVQFCCSGPALLWGPALFQGSSSVLALRLRPVLVVQLFCGDQFCSGVPVLFWGSGSIVVGSLFWVSGSVLVVRPSCGDQFCSGGLVLFWGSCSGAVLRLCSSGPALLWGPVLFWWSGSGGPGWKVSCDLVSLFRSRKCGTGGYLLTSTSSPEFDTCAIDSSVPTNHHGPGNQTPPTRCRPRPLCYYLSVVYRHLLCFRIFLI